MIQHNNKCANWDRVFFYHVKKIPGPSLKIMANFTGNRDKIAFL